MTTRTTVSVALLSTLCATLLSARPATAQGTPPNPASTKVAATASGAQVYTATCAACHQADGAGLPSQYPPLARSEFVTGNEQRLIQIVLHGLVGEIEVEGEMFNGAMPGWGPALSNAQVAAVLTYIRSAFGNSAPAVTAARVAQVRTASATRKTPYTAAALAKTAAVKP